jgi:outer membrane protein
MHTKLLFRKTILAAVSALLLTTAAHAQSTVKIALIDMKKAFDGYYKTKQAEGQIKDRAAESDKAYKGMIDDYKKANEDYKKLVDSSNDQAVSSEERDKRKKTAETKLMELQEIEKSVKQFEAQARTTINEMEKRMRDKIVGEIRDVVNSMARTGGYTLVIDSAALTAYQTPVLLYTNGENDLTAAVLKEINANAPAGSLSGSTNDSGAKIPPASKQ